ncbi:MAG: hypothetical protein DRI97_12480 [Bacteroidetes bacterium]|nr:MAG: hypothetical protein DRI97_12480 [Bacteroidota bacterium]
MVISIHSVRRVFFPKGWILGLLMLAELFLSCADLDAQRSPFDPAWTSEASQILEELDFFTDRSIYMCEELIRFRALVSVSGPTGAGPWSTVLYVELVSVDGKRMAWGKYPIRKGVSSGEIRIPADLLTGHYYLRCYTRWMRNRGPEAFTYLPIRIINPHRSELYRVNSTETDRDLLPVHSGSERKLEFKKHTSSFERGDSVALDLLLSGGQLPDSISGCFTVVPLSLAPSVSHYSEQNPEENFRVDFLPDRYGPSLSGSVKYPDRGSEGLPPALIHFTLMGDAAGYFMCRSDSKGKFTVGLPFRSGKLEIFVQPEGPDNEAVEVRIDQDFDPRQIHFLLPPFTLTDQERKQAIIMARNVQLSGIYGQADTLLNHTSDDRASLFYGTPTRSVDLDQYVLLPTLREVFLNFVPGVTPITRKKRTSLLIESENPSLSLYESLVMVDQVPVLDVERFMSLPPAKIKQIDVIEDVYVKGELRFGGVINMQSMDGDMAGVDLPDNSFFIDYLGMQPAVQQSLSPATLDDQIPDIRNTLLWMPNYTLRNGLANGISFIAPDYPGEYVILFRGLSDKGEPVVAETTFKVR